MYVVVFQVKPKAGYQERYLELAAGLRPDLLQMDGFISVERFTSLTNEGKIVSISFWRDEAAILGWRNHEKHKLAQELGRSDIFEEYTISVAEVKRHYGL